MLGPLKTPSPPKKAKSFPPWLEATLIVIFIIMAVIEFTHDEWFWAAIFGIGGTLFGISIATRFLAGDKHGPPSP